MKFSAILFLTFIGFWGFTFGQSGPFMTDDPSAYNDYIVVEQEKIGREFVGFSNVLLSGADTKTCEARRQEVVKQIELCLRRLRNMAPFKNTVKLRDEAVAVFTLYRDVHANEYARIAAVVAHQNSTISQLEEFFSLQVVAEKKMKEYTGRLLAAQQEFAKQNNLIIQANPMQKQFDNILEGNIYNREVTLAYLQVAKPNEAWWAAMQARDAAGMKTAREALLKAAEGSTLAQKGPFMGSLDFKNAAMDRIKYYQALAGKEYLEIEQILGAPAATAAQIDRINAIIDGYNLTDPKLNQAFNDASLQMMRLAMGN